jgi:tetratricopeptide (TPR) repeat protein
LITNQSQKHLPNAMKNHSNTRPTSPRARLEEAIRLAKSGQRTEACQQLRTIVALQPVNQAAWLWLSAVTNEQAEAEAALTQAKSIDPTHPSLPQAEQWLIHRYSTAPPTKETRVIKARPAEISEPEQKRRLFGAVNTLSIGLVVVALLIGLVVFLLGLILDADAAVLPGRGIEFGFTKNKVTRPAGLGDKTEAGSQADVAIAAGDWNVAITLLEQRFLAEPNSRPVKVKLAEAYLQRGLTSRNRGYVEEAAADFDRALARDPLAIMARRELKLASAYLSGTQHYQAGRWQAAIAELETVWAADSGYPSVRDLLYSAYYNHGLALHGADQLALAKEALGDAIALRPDLSGPRRQLAEIEFAMAPETPFDGTRSARSAEDGLILVGIAEQRMVVFNGEEQVFDFVVSTGEPGRDTAIGEFEIQNKIDMAYASTWNLDMPFWMGIYWSGPLQNGIHSLPIVKHTGDKLWDGYLGQRVSYGCVILSDDDAATLYDWTEVGTKVKIVPSLARWSPEE